MGGVTARDASVKALQPGVLAAAASATDRLLKIRREMVMTAVQFEDAGKMLVMVSIALFYPLAMAFALVVF